MPDERYLFRFFVGQGGAGVLAAVCGILPYLVKRLLPSQASLSTFSFLQTSLLLPFSTTPTSPSSSSSSPPSSFPGRILQLDFQHQGQLAPSSGESRNLDQSNGTSFLLLRSNDADDDDNEEVRWSLYSSIFVFSICICILLICAFSYRALRSSRLFSHLLDRPQSTSSSSSATGRVPHGERRRGEGDSRDPPHAKKTNKEKIIGGANDDGEEASAETIPLADDESPPHRRQGEGRDEGQDRIRGWMNDSSVNGERLNDVTPMTRQTKGKGPEVDDDLHISVISTGEKEKDLMNTWADKRVKAEIRNAFLVFFVSGVLFPGISFFLSFSLSFCRSLISPLSITYT